ncbi:uncharacterized protein F4822DRAFT_366506 [Hypoxylon trugodes]|uniref:uncharacterized protein n=1 Tax=Hypoxylon trugodes TaxID=326681 RepID=UPI0021995C4F|nr:uncharacterized protein F4822DRAFT_366506 [Hypoxylon trugodes]KAI1384546.1 hypothetical protein F4822DRAFT_366506 [Hypoxylon trugodes]
MVSVGKLALVAVLVGLSAFGFRATIVPMSTTGIGKVLNEVSGRSPDGIVADLLGAPTPFKRVYTGSPQLDSILALLVSFFAALVDDHGAGWEVTAFYTWAMAQFVAGWTLLVLESRRSGNRGRIVSWIGIFGFFIQTLTWTFTVPLYLAIHLLTSPTANLASKNGKSVGDAARRSLVVYGWDLVLIPLAVTVAFIVPAIFMSIPSILDQTAATHYNLIAFWQVFPVWTTLIINVLSNVFHYSLGEISPKDAEGKPTTPGKGFLTAVSSVYRFGLTASVVTHVPILLVSLLPASLRSTLISTFPDYASLLSQVTFARTFVPLPPSAAPTINPADYAPGDLAAPITHFLQYDLYVGTGALLLWALYINLTTPGRSAVKSIGTFAFWTIAGGPAAGAFALLWDRDEVVKEGESNARKRK